MSYLKSLTNAAIRWRWKQKPAPLPNPAPAPPPSNTKISEYFLNDPGTPDLFKTTNINSLTEPSFVVKSYRGGGFAKGSVENQAAGCMITITDTISYFNSLSEKPMKKWATVPQLAVTPRAGVDLNAYYDRRSLRFFHFTDTRVGGTIYAADSTDVVSHELGHAILDSYRPDMFNAASLEIAAFHESFGDFTAMMYILTHDEVIQFVLKETAGDLRKTNIVSRLAEQLGKAIYLVANDKTRLPDCLRSALNAFKYVNPGTLPKETCDSQLAAESHNFSRIFSGALYDIFVMIYEDMRNSGNEFVSAIKYARDQITKYMLKAIQNVPLNVKFYESMAKTILWTDVILSDRKYHDRMQNIFYDRQILSQQLTYFTTPPHCDNEEKIYKTKRKITVKLNNHLGLRIQSDNPLYNVEIEIPREQGFLYDKEGYCLSSVIVPLSETIECAFDMVDYLHQTNKVSYDSRTPFEIKQGKLIRTHFDCNSRCLHGLQ